LSSATETAPAARAHGGDVAQEQLVLQVLGAGGDDGLAAPQQGRHQVGKVLPVPVPASAISVVWLSMALAMAFAISVCERRGL
jgi:hypothetical protein